MLRQVFYVFIIALLVSCNNMERKETALPIINPLNNSVDCEKGLSALCDGVHFVQLDSEYLFKGATIDLIDDTIVATTELGVLLYDTTGKFIRTIGCIGEGPEEYERYSKVAVNRDQKLIYVYSNYRGILLSFTLEGKCANRIKISLPENYNIRSFIYDLNSFYFFSYLPLVDRKQILWLQTDSLGQVIGHKVDPRLKSNEDSPTLSGHYCSLSSDGFVYANHYSDTIYQKDNNGINPVAVWAEGDFRMKIEESNINSRVFFRSIGGTPRWLILFWAIWHDDGKIDKYLTYYDKKVHEFHTFQEPYSSNIPFVFSQKGNDYLVYSFRPEKMDETLHPLYTLAKQADEISIDEEGNVVLVFLRLKK